MGIFEINNFKKGEKDTIILSFLIESRKIMKLIKKINKPKVLIYDDENIKYIVGDLATFDHEPQIEYYDLEGHKEAIPIRTICNFALDESKLLDNIMLDETTMKRIAKYNKEVEVTRLDNTIKEKQDKIKELDNILQDKEGRVKKLKEFVANIYNIDLDEDDEDYDWD